MKPTSNRHLPKHITDLLADAKRQSLHGAGGHGKSVETVTTLIATGKITREKSHDGKARFRTYDYAENEVRPALEAKYGKHYEVYACPYCSGWHLATREEFAA